jgi:MFS family permease
VIVAAVGFSSDPVNTESPAFAVAFGRPDNEAGYLIGGFGAGAVLAAFLIAGRVTGSRSRMVITLLMLGGGMVAYSLVPWFAIGYLFLVVAGFGYLASNTAATSRLQLDVEDRQRGRIMALWSAFGVRAAAVVLALPVLVIAAVIYFLQRHHRTLT